MADNQTIYWPEFIQSIQQGSVRMLSRGISFIENEVAGYEALMQSLPAISSTGIIGITGPPGAGKSTLTDAIIGQCIQAGKKVAVLCVDPSSPFNFGALLGDRIRMSEWYNHPGVYIRSLASRGSLGGLHPKIIEITELLKAAGFDYILIETVGVGQSEVEIAGLADTTVVVLVPESGDDIQVMKAGLMEIADIFVVNKYDRPDAALFVKNLQARASATENRQARSIPIIQTVAHRKEGIEELFRAILDHQQHTHSSDKKYQLLAQRAYHLIQEKRMKDVDKGKLAAAIKALHQDNSFNLYRLVSTY